MLIWIMRPFILNNVAAFLLCLLIVHQANAANSLPDSICLLYDGPQDLSLPTGCFTRTITEQPLPAAGYSLDAMRLSMMAGALNNTSSGDTKSPPGYYIEELYHDGRATIIRPSPNTLPQLLGALKRAAFGNAEVVGVLEETLTVLPPSH